MTCCIASAYKEYGVAGVISVFIVPQCHVGQKGDSGPMIGNRLRLITVNCSLVFVIVGVCVWSLSPREACAQPYVIDQANDTISPYGGWVVPQAAPVGQEFAPALPLLDVVELAINSQNIGMGGTAFVQIRHGSITGPILGVSQTASIPAIVMPVPVIRFDFFNPVSLIPGTVHVIEVIATAGQLGVFVTNWGTNPYPGGAAIAWGQLRQGEDLWFREGFTVVVAVEEATWGRVKSLFID